MLRNLRIILAAIVSIIIGFFIASNVLAEDQISLNDIIHKSLKATKLPKKYGVSVDQTITTREDAITPSGKKPEKLKVKPKTKFDISYDPASGMSVKKKKKGEIPAEDAVNTAGPDAYMPTVEITVDMPMYLERLLEIGGAQIAFVDMGNESHYKISGKTGDGIEYEVWLHPQEYYVYRTEVKMQGIKFAETNIQYRKIDNKYWVPSQIVIDYAWDGSHVVQQFQEYMLDDQASGGGNS